MDDGLAIETLAFALGFFPVNVIVLLTRNLSHFNNMQFRTAQQTDLVEIVKMLADDPLGSSREEFSDPPKPCYLDAFRHIEADPNNDIIVAIDTHGELLGFLQLTYIPNLTMQGSWRAQLEGVRVKTSKRSAGIGKALIEHAIQCAQAKGCRLIQLTSNRARTDALRFYESLEFTPSHVGFKLTI